MSKLLVALLLASTSTLALADGHFGGYHGRYHGGYGGYHSHYYHGGYGYGDILVPMVIGGAVGYAISEANRQPQIYQQPTVIYQQAPTVTYQKCTAWVETVDQYGVTTRTRTCY